MLNGLLLAISPVDEYVVTVRSTFRGTAMAT